MPSSKTFTKEFKETVLSCLVQDKNFLREAHSVLKPEYFEQQNYVLAAEGIFNAYKRDGYPPSRTGLLNDLVNSLIKANKVKDKAQESSLALQPAQELISRIYQPLETTVKDVKDEFLRYCRTKEMQSTVVDVYKRLEAGDIDHNEVLGSIRQTYLRTNTHQDVGIEFFKKISDLPAILAKSRSRTFTIGIPAMDRVMKGGMSAGTLTSVIGRAKGGKSMFLLNTAYHNLLRGMSVVVFTLEISDKKWGFRMASRISGVQMDELSEKIDLVMDQCNKFERNHRGKLIIKEYATSSVTVDSLRSYLYYIDSMNGFKPDVIVVDYADLIRANARNIDERFIQKVVYEDLRALSAEFDCAIITATQCNRQAVDKPVINMKDIAESFSKVQISDNIFTICQTDVEEVEKRLRIYFAGSRESATGLIIPMRVNWSSCYMNEIDEKKELAFNEAIVGKKKIGGDYF